MKIWNDIKTVKPTPWTEVYVLIEGHRNPMFRNSYVLVAYMDEYGDFHEEMHPSKEPLAGILSWTEIVYD